MEQRLGQTRPRPSYGRAAGRTNKTMPIVSWRSGYDKQEHAHRMVEQRVGKTRPHPLCGVRASRTNNTLWYYWYEKSQLYQTGHLDSRPTSHLVLPYQGVSSQACKKNISYVLSSSGFLVWKITILTSHILALKLQFYQTGYLNDRPTCHLVMEQRVGQTRLLLLLN